MDYSEYYKDALFKWVCGNVNLIEEILGERILSIEGDKYTSGTVVKTTVNNYWFGWSYKIGGKVCFNDWGNGTEGEISPDCSSYTIERYDA